MSATVLEESVLSKATGRELKEGEGSERLARAVARHAAEKKAQDVRILDLRDLVGYTDFFVITTGNTDRQVKAVYDAVRSGIKDEFSLTPSREEGVTQAQWILLDYLDVILHVFTPELRSYYRLEQLWGEAPEVW